MAVRDVRGRAEKLHTLQQLSPDRRMLAHHRHLLLVQLPGLDQDRIRQGQLADIVQQGTPGKIPQRFATDADAPCQADGHPHYPLGVITGLPMAQIHRRYQYAHRLFIAVGQPLPGCVESPQIADDLPI
jgi:hypothetical protein